MDLANRSRKLISQQMQSLEQKRNLRISYARWLFVLAIFILYGLQLTVNNQIFNFTSPAVLLIAGYAVYSIIAWAVSAAFGRQFKLLPVVTLWLDVILALAISWQFGKEVPIFAMAYLPALLLVIVGGIIGGGLAVLVVGITNTAFFLSNSTLPGLDLKSNLGLIMLATFLMAILVVVSLFIITQSRTALTKADKEVLEEAIANANSSNLQELQNRVKAVYRVASTLSATLDYQKVVRNILVEVESVFDLTVGTVLIFEGTVNAIRVADAIGLTEEEMRKPIETRYGVMKEALAEARPILVADEESMDEWRKIFPSLNSCHNAMVMPMRGGYEVYGLLLIASKQYETYHETDLEMLVALTSHTVVAMQNATLYRNLLEDRNKMLTAEEEVRHTLARNLHDGPAQAVAAFSMQTEFIRRLFRSEPERAMQELQALGKQAQQTSKEIRTLLYELRPLVLESQGLNAALEQYAARFPTNPNDPQVHFSASNDFSNRLNPAVENTVFTILQEAVNNTRKHAQAHNIWLHLDLKDGFLVASAQDDGKGFDLASVERSYDQRGSLGLTNMRERAALVSGTVNIVSQPGRGTSVIIRIPLTEATLAAPGVGATS